MHIFDNLRLIEFFFGFLIFGLAIILNVFITKNVILKPKSPRKSKTLAIVLYPLKFAIYLGSLIITDRIVGITFSFLVGVMTSLFVFLLGVVILTFLGSRVKR